MKNILLIPAIFIIGLSCNPSTAQSLEIDNQYLVINAKYNDPVYTTYAAAMERSRMYGDKAYKMIHYNEHMPITYENDNGGKFYSLWLVNQLLFNSTQRLFEKPVIRASFPDMSIMEYQLLENIDVQETFFVYSSQIAVVEQVVTNNTNSDHNITLYPVFDMIAPDSLHVKRFDENSNAYYFTHNETLYRLISSLYSKGGYPTAWKDMFVLNEKPSSYGAYNSTLEQFSIQIKTDHYAKDKYNDSLNLAQNKKARFVSLQTKFTLKPGESKTVRFYKLSYTADDSEEQLLSNIEQLNQQSLQKYVDVNVERFNRIPQIPLDDEKRMIYLSSLNLAAGCMIPPSGKTAYNSYVFSRNPMWGWGHGHQVLHESLSMLGYVYLDPVSAENSQRVYMEQQPESGLIAYRHGPRGLQDYPHYCNVREREEPTTSAPFYSWINWEVYEVSQNKNFLADAYESGVKYTNWLIANRDIDEDGMFEWGPYGIIENVRDWYNAVFQVSSDRYLDVDKEDISDELECLDLTAMVINEMRHLSRMATELGKTKDAKKWTALADQTSALLNTYMWDDEKQFYYSVNRDDHSFMYLTRDLRRDEIIGFLPMLANAAPDDRAELIVENYLLNKDKFWRKYGVPTLAADDEWYSPYTDYCCKWNGPVWLLWDYMVYKGLKNYNYDVEARQLAEKMILAASTQLKNNHNFWESFSPDNEVLGSPTNYIWDAILAKLIVEEYSDN